MSLTRRREGYHTCRPPPPHDDPRATVIDRCSDSRDRESPGPLGTTQSDPSRPSTPDTRTRKDTNDIHLDPTHHEYFARPATYDASLSYRHLQPLHQALVSFVLVPAFGQPGSSPTWQRLCSTMDPESRVSLPLADPRFSFPEPVDERHSVAAGTPDRRVAPDRVFNSWRSYGDARSAPDASNTPRDHPPGRPPRCLDRDPPGSAVLFRDTPPDVRHPAPRTESRNLGHRSRFSGPY